MVDYRKKVIPASSPTTRCRTFPHLFMSDEFAEMIVGTRNIRPNLKASPAPPRVGALR
jgi:hypothetical protein